MLFTKLFSKNGHNIFLHNQTFIELKPVSGQFIVISIMYDTNLSSLTKTRQNYIIPPLLPHRYPKLLSVPHFFYENTLIALSKCQCKNYKNISLKTFLLIENKIEN